MQRDLVRQQLGETKFQEFTRNANQLTHDFDRMMQAFGQNEILNRMRELSSTGNYLRPVDPTDHVITIQLKKMVAYQLEHIAPVN